MLNHRFITATRLSLGLSQAEVARRCGIGRSYYGHLEQGRQPDPPLSLAVKLAEVLQVSLMALYYRRER